MFFSFKRYIASIKMLISGQPIVFASDEPTIDKSQFRSRILLTVIAQTLLSVIFLISGMYIIFNNTFTSEMKQFASSWLGIILGYWLR
jgi:uncharacterized membrane protein